MGRTVRPVLTVLVVAAVVLFGGLGPASAQEKGPAPEKATEEKAPEQAPEKSAEEKAPQQAPEKATEEKAPEQAPEKSAEEKAPGQGGFQFGGWSIQGSAEAGWRFFVNEPPKSRRAKWEEYQDYPGSAFLGNLELRFFKLDESYSAEFSGTKWGQTDQEFYLRAARTGKWEFGFDWVQTPHILSTNAQLLATQPLRGIFALPAQRPLLPTYNSAPTLDEVGVRWDAARIFFRLTPTPELDIIAELTRTYKNGDKPFGMAFGSSGDNFYEVLQPIDQTTYDFRLKGIWAKEKWQLQFSYALSVFDNGGLNRVKADNPCFGLSAPIDAGGCAFASTGPQSGQSSLPPNNIANTFTLGGGINLPMRTRLTGNFSYSLVLQNTDFLPQTINQNLLAISPADLALPKSNLSGNVQTFLVNLGATSRPVPDWTFTAKYRLFDMVDNSDEITFPALVLNDNFIVPGRRAGRYDYVRQDAGADARWQLMGPVALTVGGGWESWLRSRNREVHNSNEAFAKAAVDATPFDWLLARLTYRAGFRRIGLYNTNANADNANEAEPGSVTQPQSVLLRKFDESNRNTQQVDLYLQFTPHETLTITPTGSYQWINYLSGDPVDPAGGRSNFLGAQEGSNWTAGADLSWTPSERLTFALGYMHEANFQKMTSRSRPQIGTAALDFSSFDWLTDITDTIDTLYAGVKVAIIPNVLHWSFNASYAYALSNYRNRNPVAPTQGSPDQNATAKAERFPAFDDELIRLETSLAYRFWSQWTAKLGYVFESWQKHDWRTDQLRPFMPGTTSIWLGNDLRNYTAHIIAASVGYQFK